MSDKQIKIGLVWGMTQYEVKTISNSTAYKPGQWLDVAQVEALCKAPNWEVVIADNQTFQQLLGVATEVLTLSKL